MVRVRVPATSANMGPGFDSLGIAFKLYNEYEFSLEKEGIIFEGIEDKYKNEDNIILMAIKKVFNKYDFKFNGIRIKIIKQDIPISRGLGSSSSCIIAGLMGAFALMNKNIDKNEILSLAVDIEGHPDNVCPAIFGGLVSTIMADNKPIYNKVKVYSGVEFAALIPAFELSTEEARAVLPKEINLKDCVYNIGRASLLISCFVNGNYKLLREATSDRLHERYRSKLIDNYELIRNKAFELGALGCFLSGAGPTIMGIEKGALYQLVKERYHLYDDFEFIDNFNNFLNKNYLKWNIKELTIDEDGAKILKGD